MANYTPRYLASDLAYQWQIEPRFREALAFLEQSGTSLENVAQRAAERCIENLLDLLSKGAGTEQAIDVVLKTAVNMGPTATLVVPPAVNGVSQSKGVS